MSPACRTGSCAQLSGALTGGQATVPRQQGQQLCEYVAAGTSWAPGLGTGPGEDSLGRTWGSHHCPPQQVWQCRGKLQGRGQDLGEVTARLVCTASPSSAGPWQWEALTARSCFAADAAADHGSLHLPRQLPEPGCRLLPVPHPADRGRQSQRAASHSHCTSVR